MSRFIFKLISLVLCIYMMVSKLGETESYAEAFNAGAMFFMAWALGFISSEGVENDVT
jgi:hypothetical protein